jgi:hypothetical protein
MGSHNRKKIKDEFCAVAADGKCGCTGAGGNKDYKEECKPSPAWNAKNDFTWNNKKDGPRQQSYAPHHIVCVASVGALIVNASGKKVDGIVRATVWCVNTAKNMIAMPLWGHTLKWYCNIEEETLKAANRGVPPFADIPQHDWDHTGTGCYIKELNDLIVELVKDMKKTGHDAATSDLAGALDDLSDDFRELLEKRGARPTPQGKGTHNGWKSGRANPKSNWYLPFSMADDGAASRKGFPKLNFDRMVREKLKWLANQL